MNKLVTAVILAMVLAIGTVGCSSKAVVVEETPQPVMIERG